ncbi:MAG: threonine-phosphate decarboxylase [Candidatus Puniceispirillaceae bacterium]
MAEHGGNLDEAAKRFGFALSQMCDLSTGISPKSYDIALKNSTHYQALPLARLEQQALKAARHAYQVPDQAALTLGAGSQMLLSALPRCMAPAHIWVPVPSYNEHGYRWEKAGHKVTSEAQCPDAATVMIIGQPNNPDGTLYDGDDVKQLLARAEANKGLLVIDEAFADAMPEVSHMALAGHPNLIILRSVGKFYGLAGLRVGFAIGHDEMIAKLADEIGPWPVATPALDVAIAALSDLAWQDAHRQFLSNHARQLADCLAQAGFEIVAELPLFVTIRHPAIAQFHHYLAKQGYWTRIFSADDQMMRLGLLPEAYDLTAFQQIVTNWQK